MLSAYSSKWYDGVHQFCKPLMIMVERGRRALLISVPGLISEISLEQLGNVCIFFQMT